MQHEKLDDVHAVETPEGVRLVLRPAGPPARMLAFLLDSLLRGVVYFLALIGISSLASDLALPSLLLLVFAGEWLYPVFFEVLAGGQTLGKRVVGIRVMCDDGTPIGWSASLLRNLLLAADLLPGTYAFGLVCMLSTRGFRRLGDLAAGSLVVHVEPPVDVAVSWPEVAPIAPALPLLPDEQRAVISYAERGPLLSAERADELARVAQPLLGEGGAPSQQLHAVAAWLLGRGGASR